MSQGVPIRSIEKGVGFDLSDIESVFGPSHHAVRQTKSQYTEQEHKIWNTDFRIRSSPSLEI